MSLFSLYKIFPKLIRVLITYFWRTFIANDEQRHARYLNIYLVCKCWCFNKNFMSAETPFKWTLFSITPPKPIFKSLALRGYYMLHQKFSSLFSDPRNILSSTNHEATHHSNSKRPPLPHHSQGQTKENYKIILHFYAIYLTLDYFRLNAVWFKYDRDWFVCKQAALRSSCATMREWSHNLHPPSCSG